MQSIHEKNRIIPNHTRDINQIICYLNQLKSLVSDEEHLAKLYEQLNEPAGASNDDGNKLNSANANPIDLLLSFANQALSRGNNHEEMQELMQSFLKSIQALNTRCASLATRIQLQGMHNILQHWTDKHSIQVKNTRVLIVTSSGPREQLIEKQYFEAMLEKQNLKNDQQGIRYIHCIEMLPQQIATVTDGELIAFLQQHELNSSIGKNMLNDALGMDKDVLAEHAPEAIRGICPFKH